MKKQLNVLLAGGLVAILFLMGVIVGWAQEDGDTASVIVTGAGLYADSTREADLLEELTVDDLLMVQAVTADGQWVQITTPDELVGWVARDAVYLNGPYLPPADGLTLTTLNRLDGWERFYRPYLDETGDAAGPVDLRAVRAFMNDQYAYILIECVGDVQAIDLVLLDIVTNNSGEYATYQYAHPRGRTGTLFEITEEAGVAHNAAGVVAHWGANALVFRVPLGLIGLPDSFNLVAVSLQADEGDGPVITDELRTVMAAVVTRETEPQLDSHIGEYSVNLRDEPRTGQILRVLEPDTALSLLGRSTNADWMLVRLADGFAGWVAADYVEATGDVTALPVVE